MTFNVHKVNNKVAMVELIYMYTIDKLLFEFFSASNIYFEFSMIFKLLKF
jgi:hypothetical protein